jgi:hypothetical protein
MRFALCLLGQPFRKGRGDGGSQEVYNDQMNAIETHLQFIESTGFDCSVFMNVETTQYNEELKKVYNQYLEGALFRHKTTEELVVSRKKQMDDVMKLFDRNDYNFIFFLRIDIYLKQKFIDMFEFTNKIKFPFVTESAFTGNKTSEGNVRLCDMFMSIPKKHYNLLDIDKCIFHEDASDDMKIQNENIEVVVDTMHDGDSGKRWNPLYYITGREEYKGIDSSDRRAQDDFPDIKSHRKMINENLFLIWIGLLIIAWLLLRVQNLM